MISIGETAGMWQQGEDWLEPTRDRLRQWGRWLSMTSSPISGAVTTRYRPPESREYEWVSDSTAERMDQILCRVRESSMPIYRVLFEYYYHPSKSIRDVATDLRISKAAAADRLKMGEIMAATWWRAYESRSGLTCVA